jgi:hypothetical protein
LQPAFLKEKIAELQRDAVQGNTSAVLRALYDILPTFRAGAENNTNGNTSLYEGKVATGGVVVR